MGKFSLEHKIKERLQGHEVHVDKRELWKALGIEEEEKDRKAIWFWWVGGIMSLVFVGGLLWYIQPDETDGQIAQESAKIEINNSIAKTGNETPNDNTTIEKLSAIIDDVKSQSNVSNETTRQNTKSPISKQNKNKLATNQGEEGRSVKHNTVINNSSIFNNTNNKSSEAALIKNEKNIDDKSASINKNLSIERLQSSIPFLLFDRDIGDLSLDITPMIKLLPKPRKFELEIFGGMGSNTRTLLATTEEFEDYKLARDSTESTLEQVSFGVSLKYIIRGGFYAKAGLAINRWNEKYAYNIGTDTTEIPVEVPDVIVVDLSGNSTTEYTEGFQTIYNTIDWVRYNRLTQIDFPITLGYEHRLARWSLFGEASGILNLKQKFTGYLNVRDGVATENPEIFKSSIGLNLGLNAGVGYGFTPRLRARLSARYYRSLGSVLLDNSSGIEQKYTSVGLRVGIGYLF